MDRDQVIDAGLALLDEAGIDALTMRKVAQHLGVQQNTVYWHIAGKPQLLDAMADRMLAGCAEEPLPASWRERLSVLAHRYRDALVRHRDGGRVVAGRYYAGEHTLKFAELMVKTMLDAGFSEQSASWTCWGIVYLTLGLVQEEQAAPDADITAMLKAATPDRFPGLAATLPYHGFDNFADRFDFNLNLMLASLERQL